MPYAQRDGLRLFYEQQGSGEPAFVFVHGWCCDHTYFQPQVDHLKSSHSVTTLDLRGFGQSGPADGDYDPPTFADDVAWLCGELGISKPVAVGHSLGGAIAIEVGARHPSLPAAVVAVDPAPIDPSPELRQVLAGAVEQMTGPDAEAVRRTFIENFLFIDADDRDLRRRVVEQMCAADMEVSAEVMSGIGDWDGGAALRACAVPTLILLADIGINDPARMRSIKPDVQLGVTVGAGHFHQLEVPEQVTPMIERFVRVAVQREALEPA